MFWVFCSKEGMASTTEEFVVLTGGLTAKTMDKGAWWALVHGVAKSRTRLSD